MMMGGKYRVASDYHGLNHDEHTIVPKFHRGRASSTASTESNVSSSTANSTGFKRGAGPRRGVVLGDAVVGGERGGYTTGDVTQGMLRSVVREQEYNLTIIMGGHIPVIDPKGQFRTSLDIVSVVFLVYTALVTPFQIAFLSEEMTMNNIHEWIVIFVLDRVVDIVFCLDLLTNFRLAWIDPRTNKLEFNPQLAATRYLRSWFLIDFISILPFEALVLLQTDDSGEKSLRLPKMLKLFRLIKITKVLRTTRIMRRVEDQYSIQYGWVRMTKFGILVVLSAHWMSCVWYIAAEITPTSESNWVRAAGMEDASSGSLYLTGLYWAVMTLTTIGYGDISAQSDAERAMCVGAMLLSVGLFSYVVGIMCSLIQSLDLSNLRFQESMDSVNEYLKKRNVPQELRRRLRQYLYYCHRSNLHENESDILSLFSPGLRTELALFNYSSILETVPQFRQAPREFYAELGLVLRPAVFPPNEYIYTEGREVDGFYILVRGSVMLQHEKVSGSGKRVQYLETKEENSCFGAADVISKSLRRRETAAALTFVETAVLHAHDLMRILDFYPAVRRVVRSVALITKWRRSFHVIVVLYKQVGKAGLLEILERRTNPQQRKEAATAQWASKISRPLSAGTSPTYAGGRISRPPIKPSISRTPPPPVLVPDVAAPAASTATAATASTATAATASTAAAATASTAAAAAAPDSWTITASARGKAADRESQEERGEGGGGGTQTLHVSPSGPHAT